jgi:putative ABC transport system ATP-binding protein
VSQQMIVVEDLTKTYQSGEVEVRALRGISFRVESGEFVAIMGPSGSGKSTLMNVLGCLDSPTAGRYQLDGVDVARLSAGELAHVRATKLGFVFQQYNLLARQSALRNVAMPLIYRGLGGGERSRRATIALRMVGMGDRLDHRPNQLSGGQQQRVAIARALIGGPAVLLADEPTGALDTTTSAEIMGILQRLNVQQGLTVVIITHEPEVAAYAQRILQVRDGLLVRDGSPEQVLAALPTALPTIAA